MAGEDPKVDLESVREKYRNERDKRLRTDGIQQYTSAKKLNANYVRDPNVDPDYTRKPIFREYGTIIIGAGFGGILAGRNLRRYGVDDFCIVDRAGDFGGVWYWNRYPGIRCDTESYVYLPILEETGYMPTEKYVTGLEIRDYARSIARDSGLYERAIFQTAIEAMEWREDDRRWVITTDRGDVLTAQFVVTANGHLDTPKLPAIKGINKFKGHCFHSSRWDYDYTGGSQTEPLSKLEDKKIAVIGNACTGVQLIPELAKYAKHIFVVQRTPSAIAPRNNRPTDPEWFKSLQPGWQRKRMNNFTMYTTGTATDEEDMVNDGWTELTRRAAAAVPLSGDADLETSDEREERLELLDYEYMEAIRNRTEAIVVDQDVAESLKAYYRAWCKRPTFSDEYLQAFNRNNVTLLDTDGAGPDEITKQGVVFNGRVVKVDCIVFASGYEVGTEHTHRAGFDPVGRKGMRLSEKWKGGLKTYRGFHCHDFPNMLIFGVTQTGGTANFMQTIREQADHGAWIIHRCLKNGIDVIDATAEAEAEWCEEMNRFTEANDSNKAFLEACTPGYLNNEGDLANRTSHSIIAANYGGGPLAFFRLIDDWRKEGKFTGLSFK